jgi:hypothetical protein
MSENRKLIKSNLRGFRSETTEKNERLKIWLAFASGVISAVIGFFYNH